MGKTRVSEAKRAQGRAAQDTSGHSHRMRRTRTSHDALKFGGQLGTSTCGGSHSL